MNKKLTYFCKTLYLEKFRF